MKMIVSAVIVAISLVATGYVLGGRYMILPTTSNAVTRLDRLTGEVSLCIPGASAAGCGYILEKPSSGKPRISN
jgi:hypothetical protein